MRNQLKVLLIITGIILIGCSKPKENNTDLLLVKSGIVKRELTIQLIKDNKELLNELLQLDSSSKWKFVKADSLLSNLSKHSLIFTNYSGGLKATGEFANPLLKDSVQKYFFDINPYNSFAYKSFDTNLVIFKSLIYESKNYIVSFSPQEDKWINNFLTQKTNSPAGALFNDVTLVEAAEIIDNYELCFLLAINKELHTDLKKYRH